VDRLGSRPRLVSCQLGSGVWVSANFGKYAQFELPGKFMKVSYNDSLSDKSM